MGLGLGLVAVVAIVIAAAVLGTRIRKDATIGDASTTDRLAYRTATARRAAETLLDGLELRTRETEFFGRWEETRLHGHRVAFQPGEPLSVMVGEFDPDEEQLSEIYLSRVSERRPMPPSRNRRLPDELDDPHSSITDHYFLNAGLPGDHALQVAEIRESLVALSPAVLDVMIYETNGVQLELDPTHATRESLAADVARAAGIVDTLTRSAAGFDQSDSSHSRAAAASARSK